MILKITFKMGRIVVCITFVIVIVVFEHITTASSLTMRPICLSFSSVDNLERSEYSIPILYPRRLSESSLVVYYPLEQSFSSLGVNLNLDIHRSKISSRLGS